MSAGRPASEVGSKFLNPRGFLRILPNLLGTGVQAQAWAQALEKGPLEDSEEHWLEVSSKKGRCTTLDPHLFSQGILL